MHRKKIKYYFMNVRLKDIMKERGVTSAKLSDMIGISKVTVSNLINNKTAPSLDTLEKIATALDVPMWQLFASPEEVAKESDGKVCPYCGGLIDVNVELKKKI